MNNERISVFPPPGHYALQKEEEERVAVEGVNGVENGEEEEMEGREEEEGLEKRR